MPNDPRETLTEGAFQKIHSSPLSAIPYQFVFLEGCVQKMRFVDQAEPFHKPESSRVVLSRVQRQRCHIVGGVANAPHTYTVCS